jgi:hypothetical protein
MATTTYDIKVNAAQALDQLKKVSSEIQKVGNDFKNVFDSAGSWAGKLQVALLAAGAASAAFADSIQDVANANNVATSEVLGLAKALSLSGGNADNAGKVFQQLNNNILEANQGNEKTIASFAKLGVSFQDLGKLSETQIRQKLLKGLAAITNASERNALAAQFFGKALMGVDIADFAKKSDELATKYQKNERAVQQAAAAYDNLSGIFTDLKIAFAEAFGPIFNVLSRMKISVEALTAVWVALGTAMVIATGAAVVGGLIKIIGLLQTMNSVVSKNKLITIVGVVASIGTGMASMIGLTKDADQAQQDLNDSTKEGQKNAEETARDQQQALEKRQKEIETLRKINEQFSQNLKQVQEKLNLELQSIGQSEEQKRLTQEIADIEKSTQTALLQLKAANDNLSRDAQARNAAAYEAERQAIIANGDVARRTAAESITLIEQRRRAVEDLNRALTIQSDGVLQAVQSELRFNSSLVGGIGARLKAESDLTKLTQERGLIVEAIGKMESNDRFRVTQALNEALIKTSKLAGSAEDVQFAFTDMFMALLKSSGVSKEVMDQVISGLAAQRGEIRQTGDMLLQVNTDIAESSRTFSAGFKKAFNEYADNATNAAMIAENMFRRATQGMEDAIVNFAKTGKFEFKNFVQMMAEELLRSQVRQLMANIMGGFGGGGGRGGGGGGGGGGILGGIGKLFGFAGGGVVGGTKPIIVGERGPEVFMPPGAGSIVPNNQLAASTNVTLNINAVDAPSFQALVARNPQFIYAVAEMGRRSVPGGR